MYERANSFLRSGDAKMAEQLCQNALQEFPEDANMLCLSARALLLLGRNGDVEERLHSAIALFPDFPRPHVIKGELLMATGQFAAASASFQKAIELGDDDPNTRVKRGRALMLLGDRDAAKVSIDESMRLDPNRSEIVRAFELQNTGKPEEAETIYRAILTRDPENVEAMRLLASIATMQREHRDAEILLKRTVELAPDFGKALADLVVNQIEQEKLNEALQNADRLTRVGPDNPDSWLYMGNARSAAGDYENAIMAYRKSLKLAPEHPGSLSGLANNLKTIGQYDEAIAVYRRCIELNPLFTESYWSLANLKTFDFEDEELGAMEKLLAHPDVPDKSQVHLNNALGLAYERRGDFNRAFEHFEKCNSVRRRDEYYDPVENETTHDMLIELMTSDFLGQQVHPDSPDVVPIFIVGLPRSGSTLIEQILASHNLVEGTHELTDLARVVQSIPQLLNQPRVRFPKSLARIDADGFSRMGRSYLERSGKYRSNQPYFTDKNPNNYLHIGLIHLMLPSAVIINARRHPLDSCLGSYKQLFAKGQPFTYEMTELAEYYVQYQRLMDYWHGVLPGKVLDVHYENVVADLESQVRRILMHCGLPFEEQCLRFHETERAVKTASSEQVRRPIYASSIDLWRNYEQHLGPVIDILEPLLRELPVNRQPQYR